MFTVILIVYLVLGIMTHFLGGMLFLPLLAAIFLRIVWMKELRRTRRGRIIVIAILIMTCILNAIMLFGAGNDAQGWHYPVAIAIGIGMALALMPMVFVT